MDFISLSILIDTSFTRSKSFTQFKSTNLDKSAIPEKSPWSCDVEIPEKVSDSDSTIKSLNFLNPAVWFRVFTEFCQVS